MPDEKKESTSLVLFKLDGATYGISTENVLHLEMVEQVTPVPETLPFVDGVVFSRGQVIPALNLRVRFGFEKIPYGISTRLIVLRVRERIIGFIVDSAREFISIPYESILPPPEQISELSSKYLTGIARIDERIILLLDLDEVLKPGDIEKLPDQPKTEASPEMEIQSADNV